MVNRHITGTTHPGGNLTAGKIPTTTMKEIDIPVRYNKTLYRTHPRLLHVLLYMDG